MVSLGRLIRRDSVNHSDEDSPGIFEDSAKNESRRSSCNPTPRSRVNFPDHIVGRCNINYDMDSGYIPVGSNKDEFLFYIHFGPKNRDSNAPVIFWTNGGPGCSAMEGAFEELGPLKLYKAKERTSLYTGTLSDNPYSWNTYAHLVTVDQPRRVGYSYGYDRRAMNSAEAGRDIVDFIRGFFDIYPEISRDTPIFIAGESFAGHYIPGWSNAIMDHNTHAGSNDRINLRGIALGNSCVDDDLQIDSPKYLEFLRRSRLLPPGSENVHSVRDAERMVISHIGYRPNFYDFRVKSVSCSGPCYDYDYSDFQNWLASSAVTEALHVCPGAGNDAFTGRAGGCISYRPFDVNAPNGLFNSHLVRALDADIPVTFYFGKTDKACDYVGGRAMAEALRWHGKSGFNAAPLMDVTIAGASAAQFKRFGHLSWIQVESAGHMVPADQPAAAFFAINHLIQDNIPWVPNMTAAFSNPDRSSDPGPDATISCAPTAGSETVAPTSSSPSHFPSEGPSVSPTESVPDQQECPTCPVCDDDLPTTVNPSQAPSTSLQSLGFDPALCPTADPQPTPPMRQVVADEKCPVQCPVTATDPQVVFGVSPPAAIAGLSTALVLVFIVLVVVLIRSRTSQYSTVSASETYNGAYSGLISPDYSDEE